VGEGGRIGVFICECGDEIASRLDVDALVEHARVLAGVVWAEASAYPCSAQGLEVLREQIRAERLDRVVVAGCTPRTHHGWFLQTCEDAGINRYLFELVDIREGCAMVHAADRERATAKASALIAMGVAKVGAARSDEWIETELERSVLVIGAGVAGLSAACHLAERGVRVTVVERAPQAGGTVSKLFKLFPSMRSAQELVEQRLHAVAGDPNITLILQDEVHSVTGHVGQYVAALASGKEVSAGAIIVATGARASAPAGLARYDGELVIDQLALEERFRQTGAQVKNVVMLESSALEGDGQAPWFRVSCMTAIKNAAILRQEWPESSVSLLFSDIPPEFKREVMRARSLGVTFGRYDPAWPPRVGDGSVKLDDTLSGERVSIPAELVVLSTRMAPHEGAEALARMVRLPADDRGFLIEPQIKLRPGQYASSGVFVAGCAHWPALVGESIMQGMSAASRAYALLAAGKLRKEPMVEQVDPEICRGCGRCAEVCPFLAITMVDGERGLLRAEHNEFLCTGCGVCVSVCPCGAIAHRYMTDRQVEAMVASQG